jgi:hypothetical protein
MLFGMHVHNYWHDRLHYTMTVRFRTQDTTALVLCPQVTDTHSLLYEVRGGRHVTLVRLFLFPYNLLLNRKYVTSCLNLLCFVHVFTACSERNHSTASTGLHFCFLLCSLLVFLLPFYSLILPLFRPSLPGFHPPIHPCSLLRTLRSSLLSLLLGCFVLYLRSFMPCLHYICYKEESVNLFFLRPEPLSRTSPQDPVWRISVWSKQCNSLQLDPVWRIFVWSKQCNSLQLDVYMFPCVWTCGIFASCITKFRNVYFKDGCLLGSFLLAPGPRSIPTLFPTGPPKISALADWFLYP